MWTPKRVLLLGIGVAVFVAGYFVYAFFLGHFDGLSLLPEAFFPGKVADFANDEVTDSDTDKKLRKAFGKECKQIKSYIKFEVRKKGLVIAAADSKFNEPDGRVKLIDFSVALFKDENPNAAFPEINTITSDYAYLTFDEPIKAPTDLNNRKIVAGELRGNIIIINNHGTAKRDDDLEIEVKQAPLFYDERTSKVWTDGYVFLLDKQTQPNPTKISGHGMVLHLTKNAPGDPKQAAKAKPKSDLSGVDLIVLKKTVEMHLYPDVTAGFMTGSAPQTPATDPKKPPEKSHVMIRTEGEFKFDVTKDIAHFASPAGAANQAFPDQVTVIREPLRDNADDKDGIHDQLICDHLTLKFRRKEATGPANRDKSGGDREIDFAHATARPGGEVVVSMDTENLACHCAELTYQCPTADRGSRTILTGSPHLEAIKDGHQIKAKNMTLVAANQKGLGQHVVAEGPGQVDLYDRNPGKGYTTHAIWKGLLTSTKYKEGERDLDLLTLTEDAVFLDDEHGQKLYGQRLKVWLEASDTPSKATPLEPKQQSSTEGARQRPSKVVASDRVRAVSPEFNILECTNLTIRFKDDVRPGTVLPDRLPAAAPSGYVLPPESVGPPPLSPPPANSAGNQPQDLSQPIRVDAPKTDKAADKPKKPIDLKARDVAIDILRSGDKNDLQELVAFGNVYVHQDGEKPEDKGVEIKGETLDLLHFIEGDVLKVFGDAKDPAQLQLGELFLLGPKVTINQKDNTAMVDGAGGMHMPSNTTFEGGKPSKPGSRLTVHWTHDMIFTGQDADFNGGVVAYQDGAELQCKTLQVAFDRKVSLKEGQKNGQNAKVEKVVAHHKVWVLDVVKDEKDPNERVISQRLLKCQQTEVDNVDNRINASGPGSVNFLQLGSPEGAPVATAPKQPAAAKKPLGKDNAKEELMLTRVEFQDMMISTTQPNNPSVRSSTFMGNVQVIHTPGDNLEADIDINKLPKNGMLLRCDKLLVFGKQTQGGIVKQKMEANNRVRFKSGDVTGVASKVIFDEATDCVWFYGVPGNLAVVTQQVGGQGSAPRRLEAQMIMFDRKANTLTTDGSRDFQGQIELRAPIAVALEKR